MNIYDIKESLLNDLALFLENGDIDTLKDKMAHYTNVIVNSEGGMSSNIEGLMLLEYILNIKKRSTNLIRVRIIIAKYKISFLEHKIEKFNHSDIELLNVEIDEKFSRLYIVGCLCKENSNDTKYILRKVRHLE